MQRKQHTHLLQKVSGLEGTGARRLKTGCFNACLRGTTRRSSRTPASAQTGFTGLNRCLNDSELPRIPFKHLFRHIFNRLFKHFVLVVKPPNAPVPQVLVSH